jgi:hypothetical protein
MRLSRIADEFQEFLTARTPLVLLALGIALLVLGVVAIDGDPVRVAAVVIGSLLVVLAILLPHLEGGVELGPGGLKANLKDRVADALPEAVASVNSELPPGAEKVEIGSPNNFDLLAAKLAQVWVDEGRCARCNQVRPAGLSRTAPCPSCGYQPAYGLPHFTRN